MKPTSEQEKAVKLAKRGKTMKLNAFAGAGKTATLVMIANELAPKKGLYLAFNKSIAQEAERKMPKNVEAKTFHSLAYNGVPDWLRKKLRVPQMHINDFIRKFSIETVYVKGYEYRFLKNEEGESQTQKIEVNKALTPYKLKRIIDEGIKHFVSSEDTKPRPKYIQQALEDEYEDEMQMQPHVFDSLIERLTYVMEALWEDYTNPEGELGLQGNHDVYLKYWSNQNPIINADFILFDEAQDADGLMLRILRKQVAQVIYVGDKHQQIYGWRGAQNALEKIDADEGFLTRSFRFGQALADKSQPILSFLGEKNKIQGTGNDTAVSAMSGYGVVDAILCRSNSGVINKLLELTDEGVECSVNIDTKSALRILQDMDELRESTKDVDLSNPNTPIYKTKNKSIQFRSWSELEMYINEYGGDMETSLYYKIMSNYPLSVVQAMLIKSSKISEGVFITTAHKSKGLEWDKVGLCSDFLNVFFETTAGVVEREPASNRFSASVLKRHGIEPDAMLPRLRDAPEEELRLFYVAMTRARKMLYMDDTALILDEYLKYYNLYF